MSVLQDWVGKLPVRCQGTLLTCVRGCDLEPKSFDLEGKVLYSQGRRLVSFLRWCIMNPADPREVDVEEGSFFSSKPPDIFKPSEFGHLPLHWYTHVMHSLEIIGHYHPTTWVKETAKRMYSKMVKNLHLNQETKEQMLERLCEDRMLGKSVVS
jgi:hypothetical protein